MQITMSRIFISYSRIDESFARKLALNLSRMGADIWIDVDDIPAGVKWSTAIQQGLDNADVMLVIISPDSMQSPNVEDEWQYYLDQNKPVIPVLWRPAKIHFQLNRVQYIDFHNLDFEAALKKLHTELAVQGVILAPVNTPTTSAPPISTSPAFAQPSTPLQSASPQNLRYMIMGGGGLIAVVLGVIVALGLLRGNDAVSNSEALLKAMSERNFGVADEFVCDAVDIREDALWNQPLENIECEKSSDDPVEVTCEFDIENRGRLSTTFVFDDDELVCGSRSSE